MWSLKKKERLAIGLLLRDTGQSVKVKSHSSPFDTSLGWWSEELVKLSMFQQSLGMEEGQF